MLLDASKVQCYCQRFGFEWYFFFRVDFLYLFQFCGNLFSAIEYNAEERNVSSDSSRFCTSNYVRLPRLALFGVEKFAYRRLYKAHKHHNKRTIYQEYHATSYKDLYSRKIIRACKLEKKLS